MVKNRIKHILFLILTIFSGTPIIQAGTGKSLGLFGGGVVAGVIGPKIFSGKKSKKPVAVQQERIVERPVYVSQPQQQQIVDTNTKETQLLKSQVDKQQQQINNLKRELRQERREAERQAKKVKVTQPTKAVGEYKEDIFDDFDPQIEG